MPTWVKFAGLWSLAAIAALALSWVAVSQVRDRVIQPVAVIPTTIVALDAATPDPTVIAIDPEIDDRQGDPSRSTSTTVMRTSPTLESSATSTTRAPSAGAVTPTMTAPRSTSTTTAPPTTSTPAPPATTTTTAPSSSGSTSSYSTPGGSVTISSAPGEVNFVSAIPQAGFTTELRETGPERVRVRFVSASTVYEFEAEWEDGDLEISTEEHTP